MGLFEPVEYSSRPKLCNLPNSVTRGFSSGLYRFAIKFLLSKNAMKSEINNTHYVYSTSRGETRSRGTSTGVVNSRCD